MKSTFSLQPLTLAMALLSPLAISPVLAQAQSMQEAQSQLTLDIAAGPLARTLNRIAQQAGLAISFQSHLTADKSAPALQGRYTLQQALEKALEGSELQAVKKVTGGYTLVKSGAQVSSVALDQLMVIGRKEHGYTAPESVSATRSYVPIQDIPRSVQVVSQQFLKDLNIERIEDALMYIPGVERANDLGQLEHSVTIRGFSSDGMVFRNGKRQNYGGQIDKHTIERIEVLKGPASVQFGANSPGGVVNVITKKPQKDGQRIVKASVDEHGKRELMADITGSVDGNERVLYRVIASGENSETHRDFSEVETATFAPSLRLLLSDDTIVDLNYQYQYSQRPINQGLPQENFTARSQIPEGLASRNFGEPGDQGEYKNHLLNLDLQQQLNDNWRAELSYTYVDQDLSTRSTSGWPYFPVDGVDEDGIPVTAGMMYRETFGYPQSETTTHQASALLHGDLDIGETNHLITLGVDYSTRDSEGEFGWAVTHDNSYSAPVFNIFNPVWGQYNEPIEIQSTDITNTDAVGLFVNDTIYLSEAFVLNAGLRYDEVERDYREVYTDGSDDYTSGGKESDISWNAGVLYKQSPKLSWYASYATSFEPNYAEPDVGEHKNSRGKQWELGIKGNLDDELLYTLVYFDLTKSNIPKTLPDDTTRFVGEQQSRGVELDISYELTDRWKLLASYAYTDAEYTKDQEQPELEGNSVPGVSPHSAALFSHYSLDEQLAGLSVFGGFKYKGSAPFNDANSFDTAAFTLIDVGVQYRLRMAGDSQLDLQAGVRNLTDEAGIWTDTWSVNYSTPRTFYMTADYRF